jgi:hypothetical protein
MQHGTAESSVDLYWLPLGAGGHLTEAPDVAADRRPGAGDKLGAGEMWNSNSAISWLIARSGIDAGTVHPPAAGRAPGWNAGLVVAGEPPGKPKR